MATAAAGMIASPSSHAGNDYGLARVLEALRPAALGGSAGNFAGGQVDLAKAFIASGRIQSGSRSSTVVLSVLLHALLLGITILVPLWFTNALDLRTYTRTLLVAPPPPPAAPAPRPPAARSVVRSAPHRAFIVQGKLVAPTSIPKQIAMVKETLLAPEVEMTGGVLGGMSGGLLGGLGGISAVNPSAPPPPAADKPREPIRVGGVVRPPRAIFKPGPDYPVLARQARVQGDVVVDSIIDANGNVVEMKVVSGPQLLYVAALKVLATWKFEPTYLDGEPTPVAMEVTIKFRITG